MFPSFHEFKNEPIAPLQYDPYFPSHNAGACTGGSGSSGPSPVTSIPEVSNDPYNTYQNNGSGYSQYPTPQSWSGSSTGSQPSPSPHNYYTDSGPGPPANGGVTPDYYNTPQQNYSGQQSAAQASSNQQQMSYYSQQPCNQYTTADQYNYTNYNGGAPPWGDPHHEPPGSSPPLYQQYGQIKNEYIEMKTPQQSLSNPGAIPPNSYYGGGGNGHVSPHQVSPHLMHPGMPAPHDMMQHDSWGGPKMQVSLTSHIF